MERVRVWCWAGVVLGVVVAGGCLLGTSSGEEDEFRDLYTNEPEPLRWVPAGERDDTLFPGGVQVLDATPAGALVSARSGAGEVEMVLVRGEGGRWEEVEVWPGLAPALSGAVHLELKDLDADTAYSVALFTPDRGTRSAVTRFRTAPAAGGARVLRFGATSCLGGANRPWPNLSRAAEAGLDFMLLAGDTVYADGSETVEDFRAVWGEAFAEEGLGDLSGATSLIATWDDHEIRNNWSSSRPGEEGLFNNARAAFHEALPWRGETLWRRLSWGKTLEVFVLDSRGERREGDYISTAQMDWLKGALVESEARFKLILNSVPITDMSSFYGDLSKEDRWQGFSDQRAELLNFIDETGLIGVFFVSGDFHYGQIARVSESGEPVRVRKCSNRGKMCQMRNITSFYTHLNQHTSQMFSMDPT